ncbi:MAG: hypothetical protein F4X14_08690 [Caldilineaceae bacterium SB0661_bin_32]|uniref:SH3 domain-containing protein n=1 Tax=Caldilineaceae bacterium SB0661_bin_32 TaxID=2605255 RepID=A0A6B1D7A0_9CHLR|nr:hypothetical protein [Caldilineaceae bacterium SB0661_bin_32]
MIDDTRRPDSETDFDEPVFSSDEDVPAENRTESSADDTPDPTSLPAPGLPVEPVPESPVDPEVDVPGIDEPVFASGRETDESSGTAQRQESPETVYEPPEVEFSAGASAFDELKSDEPFDSSFDGQDVLPQDSSVAGTDWVNIAPDSESPEEPLPETEYNFFDETPAAEVAAVPPPTRKLGRTGPVWVLGGTALVLIAAVVWLGVSRLTGAEESSTEAPSEPAVQQVVAEEPTPAPPTNTPGPAPTPTPMLLPVNANVIVGETDGQGVKLRAQPGLAGTLVEIIAEGTAMVVLEADPDAQHAEYPVPSDGYLWYRMRVTGMVDGEGNPLVGWSASEFFVVDAP